MSTRVLFPTDLSEAALAPFVVAMQVALHTRGQLQVLNVHPPGKKADWKVLPTVRSLLEAWGVLPADATVGQYEALGMHVQLTDLEGQDPVTVLTSAAGLHPWDLMVVGSRHRSELQRWADPSVSEPLARALAVPTLFLPDHGRDLVDADHGDVRMSKVLVPVGGSVDATRAIEAAVTLAASLGIERATGILLHIGDAQDMPGVDLSAYGRWSWSTDYQSGRLVDVIAKAVLHHDVDLVTMITHGHDSLRDAVAGSVTERVLHRIKRPLLAVPDLA